ncbi:MAG TPA: hypothetical protein VF947_03460 [Myxococcales bacterium]
MSQRPLGKRETEPWDGTPASALAEAQERVGELIEDEDLSEMMAYERAIGENPTRFGGPISDLVVESRGASATRPEPAGSATKRATCAPPIPEVAHMIKGKAAKLGIEQRIFGDKEIPHRLLFASVNEACKFLEEGRPTAPAISM